MVPSVLQRAQCLVIFRPTPPGAEGHTGVLLPNVANEKYDAMKGRNDYKSSIFVKIRLLTWLRRKFENINQSLACVSYEATTSKLDQWLA